MAIEAMELLVAEFDGQPLLAVLALADQYGVGVAYVDRSLIDSHLETDSQEVLSDEEWELMRPHIGGTEYDDYISNQPDLEREFIKSAFDRAGVIREY